MSDTSRLSIPELTGPAASAAPPVPPQPALAASLSQLENLVQRSLEDPAFGGVSWHKFQARAADQMAALRRAVDAGNAAELARGARTLKCVAENLAAQALAARAEELEQAASAANLKQAAKTLTRVCREIERCARAARSQLAAQGRIKRER
jgi:HPt (histidine-containing phosphotransfer) domain-containing protein